MCYELNFTDEFFFNEGEPDDSSEPVKDKPTSVWAAICHLKEKDPDFWRDMAADVFDEVGDYLTAQTVMDKIRDTNTYSNLNFPVEVWIDRNGLWTLKVYRSHH